MNHFMFWLLLRYAEVINPNRFVAPTATGYPSSLSQCLQKSGNPDGALESCAFLTLNQLDADIEQAHYRHADNGAWQESLHAFKNFRGARCRLEAEIIPDSDLICRIRLSQQYLEGLQRLPVISSQ
ncbi:MAG: glucarate dehydratase [Cardiobacteriaceae bacterium]|nr:glucarate dehydratase [Cardiobacteriaceae bacterium]